MLKIVNAFIKAHRQELGLKGYSKMSYLEKLNYLEGKVKGTKYEREIGKLTKPRVDEGIKKVLMRPTKKAPEGRGQNVRVKKEKKVRPPKPQVKGRVKQAVAKIEEKEKADEKAEKKPPKKKKTRAAPVEGIDKPQPPKSKSGRIYYLELDIKKIDPSLLKFAEENGWEVYEKTSDKIYLKKKMRSAEASDDNVWGSRKSESALRSSISKKITPDKKQDTAPEPTIEEVMDKDLFLRVSKVMTEKAKEEKLEKFKDLTIEDLRSGMRKFGREKNIRQKGINNASRESIEKFILSKNIPLSYFKKGGVNRVDIDDILNEAVKFTKDFEKENKSKIIKAILKAREEKRQDSGIELQIDSLFSTRGKIKQAIRNVNNSLSNFKSKYLRLQQERFDA